MKNLATLLTIASLFFIGMLGACSLVNWISSLLSVTGWILVFSKVGIWLVISISLGIGIFLAAYFVGMLLRSMINSMK